MSNSKGRFITIEGIDGCGKGTQVQRLKELFKDRDDVVFLRELGGQVVSEDIRALILDNKYTDMCKMTEFLLFVASRAQLVNNVIRPLLEEGKTVICERYIDSNLVYQGYAGGIDIADIMLVNKIATQNLLPDLTLYFRISPAVTAKRIAEKGKDRIELLGQSFQEKVFEGYELISQMFKDRIVPVNADQGVDEVFEEVKSVLKMKNII